MKVGCTCAALHIEHFHGMIRVISEYADGLTVYYFFLKNLIKTLIDFIFRHTSGLIVRSEDVIERG